MRSGNFPWLSVSAGISFVILYTLGEYRNSAYKEYFKSVSLVATALVILLWFIKYPFPDLLTFHDAPTTIEQTSFEMHLKHRMRAFQGVFHTNPDYALWYGWSEMVRDLSDIKQMSKELRAEKKR